MLYNNYTQGINNWHPDFKARIQENLNLAVKYCAMAIDYMADAWTGKCKSCNEESKKVKRITQDIAKHLALAIGIIIFIGVANAVGIPLYQLAAYMMAKQKAV